MQNHCETNREGIMKHRITIQSITNQKRSVLKIVFLVALVALLSSRQAYTDQTPAPSAEEIVGKALSAYASCKSYADAGRVQIIFLTKLGRRTEIKPFSTAFVRPDAFRFEFQSRRGEEEWNRYIVCTRGAAAAPRTTNHKLNKRRFHHDFFAIAFRAQRFELAGRPSCYVRAG